MTDTQKDAVHEQDMGLKQCEELLVMTATQKDTLFMSKIMRAEQLLDQESSGNLVTFHKKIDRVEPSCQSKLINHTVN
jgi:hypothetical protein